MIYVYVNWNVGWISCMYGHNVIHEEKLYEMVIGGRCKLELVWKVNCIWL